MRITGHRDRNLAMYYRIREKQSHVVDTQLLKVIQVYCLLLFRLVYIPLNRRADSRELHKVVK